MLQNLGHLFPRKVTSVILKTMLVSQIRLQEPPVQCYPAVTQIHTNAEMEFNPSSASISHHAKTVEIGHFLEDCKLLVYSLILVHSFTTHTHTFISHIMMHIYPLTFFWLLLFCCQYIYPLFAFVLLRFIFIHSFILVVVCFAFIFLWFDSYFSTHFLFLFLLPPPPPPPTTILFIHSLICLGFCFASTFLALAPHSLHTASG